MLDCQRFIMSQEIIRRLVALCLFGVVAGSQKVDTSTWTQEMEAEKLPDLSPEQKIHLFGSKTSVQSSVTSVAPWWQKIEEGLLPSLSYEQKKYLFGDHAILIANEGNYTELSRSFKELFPTVEKVTHQLISDTNYHEGRGRLKKILIPVLLAMTIIAGIVLPALMMIIKVIAVKGLWSGVVSLIISKLLGLKALLNHHHHHVEEAPLRSPYFVYLPHGKHRREEDIHLHQINRQPFDQWAQENWDQWMRASASTERN